MWYSYFSKIRKKYNMRLSTKRPLVIRLDGKDVTKNRSINILDDYKGSFSYAFRNSAKYFTEKYGGYCIFGSDEISFIFTEPKIFFEKLGSDEANYSNECISIFSQYFFDYFNNMYEKDKIFFHAKCFSVLDEKVNSYIRYRMKTITNVNATRFLITNSEYDPNLKLDEMIKRCKSNSQYSYVQNTLYGNLYYNGNKIDLNKFLDGNIEIIDKVEDANDNFNIDDFDIEV